MRKEGWVRVRVRRWGAGVERVWDGGMGVSSVLRLGFSSVGVGRVLGAGSLGEWASQ